jgi:hypothetical protein
VWKCHLIYWYFSCLLPKNLGEMFQARIITLFTFLGDLFRIVIEGYRSSYVFQQNHALFQTLSFSTWFTMFIGIKPLHNFHLLSISIIDDSMWIIFLNQKIRFYFGQWNICLTYRYFSDNQVQCISIICSVLKIIQGHSSNSLN